MDCNKTYADGVNLKQVPQRNEGQSVLWLSVLCDRLLALSNFKFLLEKNCHNAALSI